MKQQDKLTRNLTKVTKTSRPQRQKLLFTLYHNLPTTIHKNQSPALLAKTDDYNS